MKSKIVSSIIAVLFIVGLVLLVFVVRIYRETIIDLKLLLVVISLIPIISTTLTYKILVGSPANIIKKGSGFSFFFAYAYNWVFLGGVFLFLFLYSNANFSSGVIREKTVSIEKIDKLPPGRYSREWTHYMEVRFDDGFRKEVFLEEIVLNNLYVGETYTLNLKNGLWGFDTIVD